MESYIIAFCVSSQQGAVEKQAGLYSRCHDILYMDVWMNIAHSSFVFTIPNDLISTYKVIVIFFFPR